MTEGCKASEEICNLYYGFTDDEVLDCKGKIITNNVLIRDPLGGWTDYDYLKEKNEIKKRIKELDEKGFDMSDILRLK